MNNLFAHFASLKNKVLLPAAFCFAILILGFVNGKAPAGNIILKETIDLVWKTWSVENSTGKTNQCETGCSEVKKQWMPDAVFQQKYQQKPSVKGGTANLNNAETTFSYYNDIVTFDSIKTTIDLIEACNVVGIEGEHAGSDLVGKRSFTFYLTLNKVGSSTYNIRVNVKLFKREDRGGCAQCGALGMKYEYSVSLKKDAKTIVQNIGKVSPDKQETIEFRKVKPGKYKIAFEALNEEQFKAFALECACTNQYVYTARWELIAKRNQKALIP